MKILCVTDAWTPQVNGVVHTMQNLIKRKPEHVEIKVISPEMFDTFPMPLYNEILLVKNPKKIYSLLEEENPAAVHIVTEGPLGFFAARYCKENKLKYTSSYHTRFPEYVSSRLPIPHFVSYAYLKYIHNCSEKMFVTTPFMEDILRKHGFTSKIQIMHRGVDFSIFHPYDNFDPQQLIALSVGRISKEKNLEAFFDMRWNGRKICVGKGPQLEEYKKTYGHRVEFVGEKRGEELGKLYSAASVFIFTSKTDTYGLVNIEAMATGCPVVMLRDNASSSIIEHARNGYLANSPDDLGDYAKYAVKFFDRNDVANYARNNFNWDDVANIFYGGLCEI